MMETKRKEVKILPEITIMSKRRRYLPQASLFGVPWSVASGRQVCDTQMDADLLWLVPKL